MGAHYLYARRGTLEGVLRQAAFGSLTPFVELLSQRRLLPSHAVLGAVSVDPNEDRGHRLAFRFGPDAHPYLDVPGFIADVPIAGEILAYSDTDGAAVQAALESLGDGAVVLLGSVERMRVELDLDAMGVDHLQLGRDTMLWVIAPRGGGEYSWGLTLEQALAKARAALIASA